MKQLLIAVAFVLLVTSSARADIVILYGDQDGFGTGAVTYKDPLVNSAGVGEAAGTDVRLIGTAFLAPAFKPTATLSFGSLSGITAITITMSMAEFGGNTSPVDGPNSIVIDGLTVPVGFLNSFSSFSNFANPNIDTRSFSLPSTFFPLFADGSINLTGTRISERGGFGSFQIDYIAFNVTVPEPSTFVLMGMGLMIVAFAVRRWRGASVRV